MTPVVIDHCGLVCGRLRPKPSPGLHTDNVIILLDLTQLFCPVSHSLRFSFRLHNMHSWLLGGSPVESLQPHCIHTQFHWSSGLPVSFPSLGTRGSIPRGDLCENGILLLALSCYKGNKFSGQCLRKNGWENRQFYVYCLSNFNLA